MKTFEKECPKPESKTGLPYWLLLKEGWCAALEWVLEHPNISFECDTDDIVREELYGN